jgi:hypothetical protein
MRAGGLEVMGNTVQIRVGAEMTGINNQLSALRLQFEAAFAPGAAGAARLNGGIQRLHAAIPPVRFSTRAMAEDLEKGLINTHQSVHLLMEEMGVHLPRAVVGAVSEMIPMIGQLGPALLGAFALQEIPHAIEGLRDMADSMQGFGKAEKEAMEKAIEDTKALNVHVTAVERELDLLGKSQAAQAALRAKWAGEDADEAVKTLTKAEQKLADVQRQVEDSKNALSVYSLNAAGVYAGNLEAATAGVNKARAEWKLADDQALLEQRRAGEAAALEAKKSGKTFGPTIQQLVPIMGDLKKSTDDAVQSLTAWELSQQHEALQILPLVDSKAKMLIRTVNDLNYAVKEGIGFWRGLTLEMTGQMNAEGELNQSRAQGVASVAQEVAGIMQTIGARREYAALMAVYEVAEGFKALGDLDFWGAAQDFTSATMYGMAAGTGTSHRAASVMSGGGRPTRVILAEIRKFLALPRWHLARVVGAGLAVRRGLLFSARTMNYKTGWRAL